VVVVLFENRSLDNLLGRLYGPGDGKTFEGVIGKGLSNPIPEWAEHGADRKMVPYGIATDMDSPNPDSGEEYYHTNTQLFNTIDEHNRFKIGEGVHGTVERAASRRHHPWTGSSPTTSAPSPARWVANRPTTSTPIADRVHPEQVPVLSGIAREFGCSTTGSARCRRRRS
jgi:phospholipase C